MKDRTKADKIVDSISWISIILLWLIIVFLRLVQNSRPGMLGNIGVNKGPIHALFPESPFSQITPAIVGTLLFVIFTFIVRSNPGSIVSGICKYLRLAVILVALYLTVASVIG